MGRSDAYNFNKNQGMSLQVSAEVFKWLQGLAVVKEGKRNQENLMQVPQETANRLMDGYLFATIIRSLPRPKSDEERLKKLDSLKENSTPAIRLYNWGILAEVLKGIGVSLQVSDRSKLANYDAEPLRRILEQLWAMRGEGTSSSQALKVDITEIAKKGPKDATNALQFLTILVARNFKISPQQTLNLFLDNNKYLSHLLAKGVKNSFEPVWSLLHEIASHSEFIVLRLFSMDEQQNATFLFNALRTCWISKDENTASLCCQLMMSIYDQYRLACFGLDIIKSWLQNEGLNTVFFAMRKHPALTGSLLALSYEYLGQDFFPQIQLTQKSVLWNCQRQKYSFFLVLLQESPPALLMGFSRTNYFEDWNRFFVKSMKKTKEGPEALLLLAIMEEQWQRLGARFEQPQLALPNQMLNFMKGLTTTTSQLMFLQLTRTLFSLMQSLGAVKNPYAPLLYKQLVAIYGSTRDSSKVTFMSQNFVFSFKGIASLPGTPVLTPLLGHLQNNPEAAPIALAQILLEEGRLGEDECLDLLQMLAKAAFQDVRHGPLAIQAIFDSLSSLGNQITDSFMESHSRLCLAQIYSLAKSSTKTTRYLKQQANHLAQAEGKTVQAYLQHTTKLILIKNLASFMSKLLFSDQTVRSRSEAPVFHTYLKIKVELKKAEQAEILKPLLVSYYPQEEELEAKIAYYMNEAFPPKPKVEPKEKGYSHDHLSKSVSLRSVSNEGKLDGQVQMDSVTVLDPTLLKPSSFAIKDLQKLKQKRYELKTIEVQREKQRVKKQEKIQKFKTIQHEKRMVQSMTTIKADVDYRHIQTTDDNTIPSQQAEHKEKDKQKETTTLRLLDLDKQEEDSYREDAEAVMKRYRKVWRYLFYKYSSKREGSSEERAHMGQVWKMLRQYDFNLLKKEECFTMVRLVNERLHRKNDIQLLNYQGFEDFILQTALLGYGRQGHAHLPPGQLLQLFIDQLKKITKEKAGSVEIFDNPEEAYFQETEVIREFNRRLRDNPQYILPQGYKRVKQTALEFEHDLHPMLQKNIKTSYVEVLQVLDSIFSSIPAFGFHLIEPLSIKSQTFLARPALFQNISMKMKEYSKGYLNPKRSISANDKDNELPPLTLPSPPHKKEFKPYVNFSLGVKLGIAETSVRNKSIAEEVAYCMEDLICAVENQSTTVKKGNKRKLVNEAMRKKKAEMAKIQSQRKKEESLWRKRAESVKLEVQALREKRKESQKLKKKKEQLQKKSKKDKEERTLKERLMQFERVKSKIAEKKQALMEMKAVEQEKTKKEKQEYRIGVEEYFRRKKDQIRQKEEQLKRKKAEQLQKKQQSQQQKKEFVKRLYLSNLKKEEQVLEKVDQIKQTYEQAWKNDQVQTVVSQSRKPLKMLFDLLLKHQKARISATNYDEIGLGTLNYFCLKFQLVPFLLHKQDVGKIFIFATKDSDDRKATRKGLTFEKFEQVLFLVAVKGKKTLNRIIQKRKKKQKRMQAFLNAQKSAGGNHFEANDVQDSSSEDESDDDEDKGTLQDEYLFNAEDVTDLTLREVFAFLRLPNDKSAMQERYKEAIESKNTKPRNLLIKELKETLVE